MLKLLLDTSIEPTLLDYVVNVYSAYADLLVVPSALAAATTALLAKVRGQARRAHSRGRKANAASQRPARPPQHTALEHARRPLRSVMALLKEVLELASWAASSDVAAAMGEVRAPRPAFVERAQRSSSNCGRGCLPHLPTHADSRRAGAHGSGRARDR